MFGGLRAAQGDREKAGARRIAETTEKHLVPKNPAHPDV